MKKAPDIETWVNPPDRELIERFPNYEHLKIYSPSMRRVTGCSLFAPKGYDQNPNRNYPVICMLHGGYGNETTCSGITQHTFQQIMDEMDAPAIIVYPNGGPLSDFCDLKTSSSRGETSVIHEVLPFIEKNFRTIKDRKHRAVIGYSAGCYGAQKFFFKYPDLFSVCIGFGGGAHNFDETQNEFILEGLKRKYDSDPHYIRANNVYRFIVENKSVIQGQEYYLRLICGEKDFMFDNAGYFKNFLQTHGYTVDLTILKGIAHSLEKLWECAGADAVRITLGRIRTA